MAESTRVVLDIPSSLADELATASQSMLTDLLQRGLRNLRIDQALENYRQGNYSFGAAAELAGISLSDLAQVSLRSRDGTPVRREDTCRGIG